MGYIDFDFSIISTIFAFSILLWRLCTVFFNWKFRHSPLHNGVSVKYTAPAEVRPFSLDGDSRLEVL